MSTAKQWQVNIYISEDDAGHTHADARLLTRDRTALHGVGEARRNPHDPDVPEIGDELAVARALADLSDKLRQVAAADLEEITHEPVRLDS
ncbi:MAG TPA: DUF1876 domain-containing protein [Natronosporangium sp.]